eukprot:TRINITY_DN4256_c0_g1_i1.p1 TRINITY_DN4256_c0_g1~~TRINITY_DN4256_c0_g1_i1.p1  ORF type:complete len:434 (+),score=129.02 TRINITY_DN4256_c0_g1_i1:75-1304(+)
MPRAPPPGVKGLKPVQEEEGEIKFVSEHLVKVQGQEGGEDYAVSASGMTGKYFWQDLKIHDGKCLGKGSQASVKLCQHLPTKEKLAIKVCPFSQDMNTNGLRSDLAHVLNMDEHPNLVQSKDAYFREGHLYILMEYCKYGSLAKLLDEGPRPNLNIPMDFLAYCTAEIVEGLMHLHKQGIIHRDLKPSNILIHRNGHVKICDFGVSRRIAQNKIANTVVGASAYLSPERVKSEGYSHPADVWAVGVLIAELALGDYPWKWSEVIELVEMIATGSAPSSMEWPASSSATPELKDFIAKCLNNDPAQRFTAEQLCTHPFVLTAKQDEDALRKRFIDWLDKKEPSIWRKAKDQDGRIFYFNKATGEKCWRHPQHRVELELPPPWKVKYDKDGNEVYCNTETGEKTRTKPNLS